MTESSGAAWLWASVSPPVQGRVGQMPSRQDSGGQCRNCRLGGKGGHGAEGHSRRGRGWALWLPGSRALPALSLPPGTTCPAASRPAVPLLASLRPLAKLPSFRVPSSSALLPPLALTRLPPSSGIQGPRHPGAPGEPLRQDFPGLEAAALCPVNPQERPPPEFLLGGAGPCTGFSPSRGRGRGGGIGFPQARPPQLAQVGRRSGNQERSPQLPPHHLGCTRTLCLSPVRTGDLLPEMHEH